ncbi:MULTISPECIES: DUF2065 domain-containing protein [Thiomicrorhabdus]|uniref:DUF2065 domain-containing protein n=1 Tax=Thiomicrorhabdus xiamenensis TaxID=2739063 RepID=A0A7D4NQV4_9GAMM|nr:MULTISPECIES: DUF2065 domain-containing protein [Thiomicrorhabdus]MBO1924042.1 DUF2065 domain-containing protein [Thiomicrorhabdus sp. 6S3-12]QKI89070.1 DUF2065 domain-containing protein [Thiomicrorhabdus xiamenensis]
MLETLLAAIALVFILEGLMPFAFPHFWKKVMSEAVMQPENVLRIMGLISIAIGMILLLIFS